MTEIQFNLSQQLPILSNPKIEQAKLDQHPITCYLARLSKKSKIAMKSTLDVIVKLLSNSQHDIFSFPWSQLAYQHVSAIRSKLAELYSPARANTMLAAIRGVAKEAWQLGLISADHYQRIQSVPTVKGERLPKGRALASDEIKALFNNSTSNNNSLYIRDTAILAILYGCGLRRSEVVTLNIEDYDPTNQSIHIIAGKGNKDRLVYLSAGVKIAVDKWLAIRKNTQGAMFIRILKGNHFTDQRLRDQSVMLILNRHAKAANLADCSPHDLRRSFISDLLDNGADINTVSKLAGHSNITTTAKYDKRGEIAKKKAVDLIHVPIK